MSTRSVSFFYQRLASPLHAARASISALWICAVALAALIFYNPLVLMTLSAAVLLAALGSGVGQTVTRSIRTALIVGFPIVAVNVLVSRQGLTVFARLGDLGPFGQGNLTVEAVVYGAVIAMKIGVLIMLSTLGSLAVDPDELLSYCRRLSFRSALTATLATRMIPVLAADMQRLTDAQRTRPPDSRSGRAQGRLALLGGLLTSSFERALDVAATLEMRGFSAASGSRWSRGARRRRRFSRHDIAFAISALAIAALALVCRSFGVASFQSYPTVHAAVGLATVAVCVGLVVVSCLPFADRHGIDP